MAELNILTDKILVEAKEKAEKIRSEAKEKADKIDAISKGQAEDKYKMMVEKGRLEAESLKERLRSNANLKARDNELRTKQEIILKVYEQTIEDLKNLDDEKFVQYVKNNASFEKGSILVVPKSRLELIKKAFPEVQPSDDRFTKSGFIEIQGGIEKNYTFDSQLEYIKDEMQGEVAKILFK